MSTQKEIMLSRLTEKSSSGIGANTGHGTANIVIPPFPELPTNLTRDNIVKWNKAMELWRSQLQAQMPIPR